MSGGQPGLPRIEPASTCGRQFSQSPFPTPSTLYLHRYCGWQHGRQPLMVAQVRASHVIYHVSKISINIRHVCLRHTTAPPNTFTSKRRAPKLTKRRGDDTPLGPAPADFLSRPIHTTFQGATCLSEAKIMGRWARLQHRSCKPDVAILLEP